jgi:hypothetical protein
MGGLLAGAYLAFPVFVLSRWLAERYQTAFRHWLKQQRWVCYLRNSARAGGEASL